MTINNAASGLHSRASLKVDHAERHDDPHRPEPAIFFLTDHYRGYPIVLVRLPRIGRRRLAEVLEEAWREVAPSRLRSAYDARRGT